MRAATESRRSILAELYVGGIQPFHRMLPEFCAGVPSEIFRVYEMKLYHCCLITDYGVHSSSAFEIEKLLSSVEEYDHIITELCKRHGWDSTRVVVLSLSLIGGTDI